MNRLLAFAIAATASCYSHPYEVCNGLDDDKDSTTVDGVEDPAVGGECDGPDADRCGEGTLVCVDGNIVCNDNTSDNVELCNNLDDDCDSTVDEMFDTDTDPTNCGACGNACTNDNGGVACTAGRCAPTCAHGAEDCNNDPEDGCEVFRDRNPTCDEIAGSDAISADSGSEVAMFEGTDEGIYEVIMREVSTADASVRGTITLDVPSGLDFDLFVYCNSCGGAIMGSSTNPAGMREEVQFAAPDVSNVNDDHTVYVEVRYVSQTACNAKWKLTVTGNTGSSAGTCR